MSFQKEEIEPENSQVKDVLREKNLVNSVENLNKHLLYKIIKI